MVGNRTFRIWAMGDAHVGLDMREGYESLAEPLRQSETAGAAGRPPFEWDIAINVGDYSGERDVPRDSEGEEIIRQFSVLQAHRREQVYSICGNHDRSGLDEPEAWWFRKWIDPFGENAKYSGVDRSRYPFPIEGTWERYSFEVGNILFLMMSDVNEKSQKVGRGPLGGNPGGVVTAETFEWWRDMVARNHDRIIVCAHHYVLKDTTVASGDWEGLKKDAHGNWTANYHWNPALGAPPDDVAIGASYLYWVGGRRDSGAFEGYLEHNPGAVDVWLGGHTHAMPDDTYGGKSKVETKWGTNFINVSCLTRYAVPEHARPHSWLLTLTEGSNELLVQCYMHTNELHPQGWYRGMERRTRLSSPFLPGA